MNLLTIKLVSKLGPCLQGTQTQRNGENQFPLALMRFGGVYYLYGKKETYLSVAGEHEYLLLCIWKEITALSPVFAAVDFN